MIYRFPVLLIFIILAAPIIGNAQTVVDRCGSDTEPGGTRNLAKALTEGGRIVFNCPPGTEIRMTTGHTVAPGTTIDGASRVTLDAHDLAMTMFYVPNGSFAAERLTIRNVAMRRSSFGRLTSSVLEASGDIVLTDVSISASESPIETRGNARVVNSVVTTLS